MSTMLFDDTEPYFIDGRFKGCDWSKYYPSTVEVILKDMAKLCCRAVMCSYFVDADHAECQVTRKSNKGVIICVNRVPIQW